MGSADYLTIASSFHTVVITSVPVLKVSSKNQARRFISLIDALYEARCRIICLAEVNPEYVFFPDAANTNPSTTRPKDNSHVQDDIDVLLAEAVGETRDVYRPNVSSYDTPNMAEAPRESPTHIPLETLSMFSGKEEQFAFKRALSRLLEMTSESYGAEEHWAPLPAAERKWERSSRPVNAPHTQRHVPTPSGLSDLHRSDSDYAAEAAFDNSDARIDPSQRPEAPRLQEDHIWGVRDDWGERARAWGKGAKAYGSDNKTRGGS
jgi:peroxisome-assembly ATPase